MTTTRELANNVKINAHVSTTVIYIFFYALFVLLVFFAIARSQAAVQLGLLPRLRQEAHRPWHSRAGHQGYGWPAQAGGGVHARERDVTLFILFSFCWEFIFCCPPADG